MSKSVLSAVNPPTPLPDVDPNEPVPYSLTAAAFSCPSWCGLGPVDNAEHGPGLRAVAHRSPTMLLRRPADKYGDNILARAEVFALEEEGEAPSPAVVYMTGETDVVIDNVAELDAFIADAELFVAWLRAQRAHLEG